MAAHRPTILQIIPALDTGGAELSTVEIASAIVAAGGRALVATQGGRLAARIVEAGGEIVPFPAASKNPVQMARNGRALAALIGKENVDLVHARSRAPAWSAHWAAKATGRPFITTYHGAYNETGPFKRWYNSIMASGRVVIANSAYTADLIETRYGTPRDRLRIIHRGVDPVAFDPDAIAPGRREALRAAWGVAPEQRVILHAARLTRWKGQAVLIQAIARLTASGTAGDCIAVLAGADQGRTGYRQDVQSQIDGLGLTGRIKLVGHVEDMPTAFALASVAVIASIEPEAFGRTSIEAQMMGAPVIATRIGAPPETVLAEPDVAPADITGWLVPPADAEALAAALGAALALGPAARSALAARARIHARTHFSLRAMKIATLSVYDGQLGTALAAAHP